MWFLYVIGIAMFIVGISPSNTSNIGWLIGGGALLVILISWSIAKKIHDK